MVTKRPNDGTHTLSGKPLPRNIQRGVETREAILASASKLFGEKGYASVTLRQIAHEAGCSHTAIYLYFQDKESLLNAIANGPLERLRSLFSSILDGPGSPEEKLMRLGREFIVFSLKKRTLYRCYSTTEGTRVDAAHEVSALNLARLAIFDLMGRAIQDVLGLQEGEAALLQALRIYFFTLHGIASTYDQSDESTKSILERLTPTFETAIRVCVTGLRKELIPRGR